MLRTFYHNFLKNARGKGEKPGLTIWKKILPILTSVALLWLGVQYVLPLALPFLLGTALALLSEPLVARVQLRSTRGVASGFGVTVTLFAVAVTVYFAGVLTVGQLKRLTAVLPDLEKTATQGVQLVEDYFVSLAGKTPEQVRPLLEKTVLDFFDGGNGIVHQLGQYAPGLIGSAVTSLGDGAMVLGTGVLSGFFISARLPKWKAYLQGKIPEKYRQ